MTLDGLRGYLALANGVTDVTRERAAAVARALLAQGESSLETVLPGPLRAQVATLTEDLMSTSRANRDLLVMLVRSEVERSVAKLGLVAAEELDAAARRARGLEARVAELEDQLARRQTPAAPGGAGKVGKAAVGKAAVGKSRAGTTRAGAGTAARTTRKPSSPRTQA